MTYLLLILRKQDAVAIEWQQGIFYKVEIFEIEGVADANGGTMITVAPGDVISILEPDHSRIVAIL